LSLAFAGAPGSAASTYVDGISDQSLPAWDGGFAGSYFAGLFGDAWVGSPASHITLARYVVQWNVMSGGYPVYRSEFESWLSDVSELGLIPDVALSSYDGVYPSSSAEYQRMLEQVLERAREAGHPIAYLEAWNEPNSQGNESAVKAAGFTNDADAICEGGYRCTVVAGNFEDSPNSPRYEDEYVKDLNFVPAIWGVHPYYSVEDRSEEPFRRFISHLPKHLPDNGARQRIWFTEIAARKCLDSGGRVVENGEVGQSERARWLVNTLMRNAKPEHVFYYEFLLKDRRQPSCQSEGSDGALFVPSGDPNAEDRPRLAASYIWGGAYAADGAQAVLTGGVYP
jgi:hypothetical protein